jgi:hypothetical protein
MVDFRPVIMRDLSKNKGVFASQFFVLACEMMA